MSNEERQRLSSRYAKEITLWQAFYEEYSGEEMLGDVIFEHMALGFFLALGIRNEIVGGEPLSDAADLAYIFGG